MIIIKINENLDAFYKQIENIILMNKKKITNFFK